MMVNGTNLVCEEGFLEPDGFGRLTGCMRCGHSFAEHAPPLRCVGADILHAHFGVAMEWQADAYACPVCGKRVPHSEDSAAPGPLRINLTTISVTDDELVEGLVECQQEYIAADAVTLLQQAVKIRDYFKSAGWAVTAIHREDESD